MHPCARMRALLAITIVAALGGCKSEKEEAKAPAEEKAVLATQQPKEATIPPLNPNNIVSIAIASPDHTTLVAALKAADYVVAVSGSGPLTVFAPTNAAFDKLPPGTVEELTKPEKAADLKEILKYHATTSRWDPQMLKDGQVLAMANGKKATIHVAPDGSITINDAKVLASIPAENGIVHVIDTVLLPPADQP